MQWVCGVSVSDNDKNQRVRFGLYLKRHFNCEFFSNECDNDVNGRDDKLHHPLALSCLAIDITTTCICI